jgi:hypothetical protein
MKIRKLIEALLQDHTLDDEVIVQWFSKGDLLDWLDSGELEHTEEEFSNAWLAIQDKGQEEMAETLSHYGTVYEIRDLVLEEIEEARTRKND